MTRIVCRLLLSARGLAWRARRHSQAGDADTSLPWMRQTARLEDCKPGSLGYTEWRLEVRALTRDVIVVSTAQTVCVAKLVCINVSAAWAAAQVAMKASADKARCPTEVRHRSAPARVGTGRCVVAGLGRPRSQVQENRVLVESQLTILSSR